MSKNAYLQHRKHAPVTVVASMRQGAQTGVVVENELTRQSRESPSGRETSICRDLAPWEGGLSRQLHVINCHWHRAEVASGRVTRNGADALGKGQVIWTLLIKECGYFSEEARKPVKDSNNTSISANFVVTLKCYLWVGTKAEGD